MGWAGGLCWWLGLVGGWLAALVGLGGGLGWWEGLEGIFNAFEILTFFNAFF